MYKLSPDIGSFRGMILRIDDGSFIPFDPSNTDYQRFKKDIEDGAELQDADGNVMTQEQVQEFLSTLP